MDRNHFICTPRQLYRNKGDYSRKQCCFLCEALQWIYEHGDPDGAPNDANLLYTNFEPQALHRTYASRLDHLYTLFKCLGFSDNNFPDRCSRPRLISGAAEFRRIHGATPLTTIEGFSPYRCFPDVMHLVHLAIIPDVLCSLLLDLSDTGRRDDELGALWSSYHSWARVGRQNSIGTHYTYFFSSLNTK